jgi:hypothetical protein
MVDNTRFYEVAKAARDYLVANGCAQDFKFKLPANGGSQEVEGMLMPGEEGYTFKVFCDFFHTQKHGLTHFWVYTENRLLFAKHQAALLTLLGTGGKSYAHSDCSFRWENPCLPDVRYIPAYQIFVSIRDKAFDTVPALAEPSKMTICLSTDPRADGNIFDQIRAKGVDTCGGYNWAADGFIFSFYGNKETAQAIQQVYSDCPCTVAREGKGMGTRYSLAFKFPDRV